MTQYVVITPWTTLKFPTLHEAEVEALELSINNPKTLIKVEKRKDKGLYYAGHIIP